MIYSRVASKCYAIRFASRNKLPMLFFMIFVNFDAGKARCYLFPSLSVDISSCQGYQALCTCEDWWISIGKKVSVYVCFWEMK